MPTIIMVNALYLRNGNKTTYAYTPAGDLETVTDPLNQCTSFKYDDLGRMVSRIDPLGHIYPYNDTYIVHNFSNPSPSIS